MVFQFAAGRATLAPADAALAVSDAALAVGDAPALPCARIVFIVELGVLSKAELDGIMETCVADR
jgi:hypothetical protein